MVVVRESWLPTMPAGFEVPAVPDHIGGARHRLQLAVDGSHVFCAGLCTVMNQLARPFEDGFAFERSGVGLAERFAVLPLPIGPVLHQAITETAEIGLVGIGQAGPHLAAAEYIGSGFLGRVNSPFALPGIARWIPHGEGTIGHGIHHQAGLHGAASRADPRFLFEIEAAGVGLGLIRFVFTIHPEADFSRLGALCGLSHGTTIQARVQLLGPAAGEAIPGHIKQKALAKAVVTRDQVEPWRQLQLQGGSWAGVAQLQVMEQGGRPYSTD